MDLLVAFISIGVIIYIVLKLSEIERKITNIDKQLSKISKTNIAKKEIIQPPVIKEELNYAIDNSLDDNNSLEENNSLDDNKDKATHSCEEVNEKTPPTFYLATPPPYLIDSNIESENIEDATTSQKSTGVIHTEKPKKNYEKIIGENIFSKIGILVLIIGVGTLVKHAIYNNWIDETVRCILGFVIGGVLLLVAERLSKKYRAFSSLLAGGSFAIFYLTIAISYHNYELFPQSVSFILLIITTIFMIVLSLLYNRKELGIIALTGGFIAPFIIGSGEVNIVPLLTYICFLNVGMILLAARKKWAELPILSFIFTYIILSPHHYILDSDAYSNYLKLLIFETIFYLMFAQSFVYILKSEITERINKLYMFAISANNFLYLGLALNALVNLDHDMDIRGVIPIFIAIVNMGTLLWIKKYKGDDNKYYLLKYVVLSMVLTFVTLSIPIQLSGRYITIFWAAEMAILTLLYAKSKIKIYNYFSLALFVITIFSVAYNISTTNGHSLASLMTYLFVGGILILTAYILSKYKDLFSSSESVPVKYSPFNAIYIISAILIIYYSLYKQVAHYDLNIPLYTSLYLSALIYILPIRFPFKNHLIEYFTAPLILIVLSLANRIDSPVAYVVIAEIIAASLIFVKIVKMYLTHSEFSLKESRFYTIYLNYSILVISIVSALNIGELLHINIGKSWIISISIIVVSLSQMMIGMRFNLKLIRLIAIANFGIILLKLMLIDVWLMSSTGKIVTFFLLGTILLTLSFLYQKLKKVLFKDED